MPEWPGSNSGHDTTILRSVLYFFSCFHTFDFKYIFFSFNLFFFLNIYKKNNNRENVSIVECEALVWGAVCFNNTSVTNIILVSKYNTYIYVTYIILTATNIKLL